MIKKLPLKTLHFLIVTCVLIYAAVQWMKYVNYEAHPFFYNYANDLIVIPIIAMISLHVVWWIKKNRKLRLGILSLLSLVVMYSVYFEYYLPKVSLRYTSDIWDVAWYIAGAILFYMAQKLP